MRTIRQALADTGAAVRDFEVEPEAVYAEAVSYTHLPNGVRTAMQGQERVFHLAALIAIPFSYHSPDSYVDTNIKGTLNVLQLSLIHI